MEKEIVTKVVKKAISKKAAVKHTVGVIAPNSYLTIMDHFFVKKVNPSSYDLVSLNRKKNISVSKSVVEEITVSSDSYNKTEFTSSSAIIDVISNNSGRAMTICFVKQGKELTQAEYKRLLKEKAADFMSKNISNIVTELDNLLQNPILKTAPGEVRVAKGIYTGKVSPHGRLYFIDFDKTMEITSKKKTTTDSDIIQVDPRTIQFAIINNVKYIVKK